MCIPSISRVLIISGWDFLPFLGRLDLTEFSRFSLTSRSKTRKKSVTNPPLDHDIVKVTGSRWMEEVKTVCRRILWGRPMFSSGQSIVGLALKSQHYEDNKLTILFPLSPSSSAAIGQKVLSSSWLFTDLKKGDWENTVTRTSYFTKDLFVCFSSTPWFVRFFKMKSKFYLSLRDRSCFSLYSLTIIHIEL